MSLEFAARFLGVVAASTLASGLLAHLAPRLGWTDAAQGTEAARKRQKRPVPAIGGAALLLAVLAAPRAPWGASTDALWGSALPGAGWMLASLLACFAVGTWDDRRGLGPGAKFLWELLGLAPLLAGAALEHGAPAALALAFVALVALNLLNTFDNADGALTSMCALGFAFTAPFLCAACLGFLPWNLDARRARNRASGAPSAYLGDAGAFVLAFFLLAAPRSAGLLVLPGLDLARLALLRWRAGSRPWIGDRRHLAHRLEARGLARPLVAALQCAAALPACGLVERALATENARLAGLGILATIGLYALLLALSRPPSEAESPSRVGGSRESRPCPGPGGAE